MIDTVAKEITLMPGIKLYGLYIEKIDCDETGDSVEDWDIDELYLQVGKEHQDLFKDLPESKVWSLGEKMLWLNDNNPDLWESACKLYEDGKEMERTKVQLREVA